MTRRARRWRRSLSILNTLEKRSRSTRKNSLSLHFVAPLFCVRASFYFNTSIYKTHEHLSQFHHTWREVCACDPQRLRFIKNSRAFLIARLPSRKFALRRDVNSCPRRAERDVYISSESNRLLHLENHSALLVESTIVKYAEMNQHVECPRHGCCSAITLKATA